jgi:adenine-specific DNA-methyltransferase
MGAIVFRPPSPFKVPGSTFEVERLLSGIRPADAATCAHLGCESLSCRLSCSRYSLKQPRRRKCLSAIGTEQRRELKLNSATTMTNGRMHTNVRAASELCRNAPQLAPTNHVFIARSKDAVPQLLSSPYALWENDVEQLLSALPDEKIFDLIVTSPPYNVGKSYEKKSPLDEYLKWQTRVIEMLLPKLKDTGSICWQVGNFVDNGHIIPLDIQFDPVFRRHGLLLRNRIIWHFGHGLHNKHRFSGRYEVILWYTKSDDYVFNLDAVRIPSKYPGKRHFKGPKAGQLSGNPRGKNPEDVWGIPNVKSNHIEKTARPCQFPVGLIEQRRHNSISFWN